MIGFVFEDKRKNHHKKNNPFVDFIIAKRERDLLLQQAPWLKVEQKSSVPGITEEERNLELKKLNKN